MPATHQVTCDQCGADLTTTGNCEDWRIAVCSDPIPTCGGVVTMMHKPRPMRQAAYFCDTVCLAVWAARLMPDAEERLAKKVAWREKLAERRANPA